MAATISLSVLEIIAISVPLIAIVVIQIFSSDLDDRMSDEILRIVSRLLILTGFFFLIGIIGSFDAILSLSLDPSILVGTVGLAFGLSLLVVVVLMFPMYLLATSTGGVEQTELPTTDKGEESQEQDLGRERKESTTERETDPELNGETK